MAKKKKKTGIRKLLNTTVYNGKDVVAIVDAVVADAGQSNKEWDRVKVRYLTKPVESNKGPSDDGLLWARAERPYHVKVLTVALLAPNKINVLDALARVGDGVAHERIAADLIASISSFYYSGGDTTDATKALKIRLMAAVDAHEKLRSAHENLTRDVNSRAGSLAMRKQNLARAQRQAALLSIRIPKDEAKLAAVQDRLDKSKARMKAAGLL